MIKFFKSFFHKDKKKKYLHVIKNEKVNHKNDDQVLLSHLHQIFCHSIDYQDFHDRILSDKGTGDDSDFNNLNFSSYSTIKSFDPHFVKKFNSQDQIDLNAGIKVYDEIVDVFVARFFKNYPEMNQPLYLPSLKLVALGLAIKTTADIDIPNSQIMGFLPPDAIPAIQIYNEMEREFLKAIDWNTTIDELLP